MWREQFEQLTLSKLIEVTSSALTIQDFALFQLIPTGDNPEDKWKLAPTKRYCFTAFVQKTVIKLQVIDIVHPDDDSSDDSEWDSDEAVLMLYCKRMPRWKLGDMTSDFVSLGIDALIPIILCCFGNILYRQQVLCIERSCSDS